jgi:hypothetical protein
MHRRFEEMKKGLDQQEVEVMEKRATFEVEVKEWKKSLGELIGDLLESRKNH